jgi:hypothetical protein
VNWIYGRPISLVSIQISPQSIRRDGSLRAAGEDILPRTEKGQDGECIQFTILEARGQLQAARRRFEGYAMTGVILLALPGVICLLMTTLVEPLLFPGGHQLLLGVTASANIVSIHSIACMLSPITTIAAIVVTAVKFSRMSATKRLVMMIMCAVATVGVVSFWGSISMIGYRGY